MTPSHRREFFLSFDTAPLNAVPGWSRLLSKVTKKIDKSELARFRYRHIADLKIPKYLPTCLRGFPWTDRTFSEYQALILYLKYCRQRQATIYAMMWCKLLTRLHYVCMAKFLWETCLFMQIMRTHRIWKSVCLRAWTHTLQSLIDAAAPVFC